MRRQFDLSLYFIMGSNNTAGVEPLSVLEGALRGGITCFQLREKGVNAKTGNELYSFAEECFSLCRKYDVPFIVNDHVDLAISLQADGIHIGQDDEDASTVKRKLSANQVLGVSVHSEDEAEMALINGADYVGVGPMYRTKTKKDANEVIGPQFIQTLSSQYRETPIVGIGGISLQNCDHVIQAGASGIAVISAISSTSNPELAARQLLYQIRQAQLEWG